jgi:hypothetical protein
MCELARAQRRPPRTHVLVILFLIHLFLFLATDHGALLVKEAKMPA